MPEWLVTFRAGLAALRLTLNAEQEALFTHFLALLLERNTQVNLTAITEPHEVAIKHFVDSLTVEQLWRPQPGDRILDIGTGAGLPGIPLAIRHPEITVVLNDSVRKKVDFLQDVATALPLPNVTPVWARAEELGRQPLYRAYFNTVFVRAVAHVAVLAEYALPLLKNGGSLIALKGPGGTEEVAASTKALELLGGVVSDVAAFTLPGAGERVLIQIRKTRPTPSEYPRPAGVAKKRPLWDSGDAG